MVLVVSTGGKIGLCQYGILLPEAFNEVVWQVVHNALWEVPRFFQIWVAKQVMELTGTMKYRVDTRRSIVKNSRAVTLRWRCVDMC